MSNALTPVRLAIVDEQLVIEWSDSQEFKYTFAALRDACPCATCREKKSADKDKPANPFQILKPAEAAPVRVVGMKPIGNYAYGIAFSDGHDTGIYSMEVLRQLGQPM